MSSTPNPEVRFVKANGELGEILPDWRTLEYLDDTQDVGSVTVEYPERGGLRRNLLRKKQEFALTLDGKEIDNSRFILEGDAGNRASDTPGYVTWTGQTYIAVFDEALVMPLNDQSREDVLTPEEKDQFRKQRDEWVEQQIDRVRKNHMIQEINLTSDKNADDDERDDDRNSDLLGAFRGKGDGGGDLLGDWDGTAEGDSDQHPKIHGINDDNTWIVKLDPAYWRHRFEPSSDLQEKMDTAPPPKPPTFANVTPGFFMKILVNMAKSRGAIPDVRMDFDEKRDSAGRPWERNLSRKPDVGSSLLEQLRWLAESKHAEPRMRRRTLQLFNADYGDPDKAKVLFARGKNIVDGPQEGTTDELVTAVFCTSDTGVHGWVYDEALVDRYGVLEGTLEVQGVQTWRDLRKRGRDYLKENGREKNQTTFGVTALNQEGTRPYRDYRAGTWVLVATDGDRPQPQRIRAITMSWDESRNMAVGITLNDRLYESDVTIKRAVRALTGKTVGGTAARKVTGFVDSATQVSDERPPARPSPPAAVSRNGSVEITAEWTDANGHRAIWDQDVLEVHKSTEADYTPSEDTLVDRLRTAGKVVLANEQYGEPLYVRFVAVDAGGDRSEPSDVVEVIPQPVTGNDLGGDVTLPPNLIGPIPPENLTAGQFQARIAVAAEFVAAEYATDDPGETQPAETSSVVMISSANGFTFSQPTYTPDELAAHRTIDADFPQTWYKTVEFPSQAFDDDGNRVAAVFRGRVEADEVGIYRRLSIQGNSHTMYTLEPAGTGLTSYTITFNGETTGSISATAQSTVIVGQLLLLPSLEIGDVTVEGGPLSDGKAVQIRMGGQYTDQDLPLTVQPTGGDAIVLVTTAKGSVSNIAPEAGVQLDQSIQDPDGFKVTVSQGVVTSRWPGLPAENVELGWGIGGSGNVNQLRLDTLGNGDIRWSIRKIDPVTGFLISSTTSIWDMKAVGGFTTGGGKHWLLAKATDGKWYIYGVNDQANLVGPSINVNSLQAGGYNTGALSWNDTLGLTYVYRNADNQVLIRYYGTPTEDNPSTWLGAETGIVTTKPLVGAIQLPEGGPIAVVAGNRVYRTLTSGGEDAATSWWSQVGNLTGVGILNGATVATNQSGALIHYNDARPDNSVQAEWKWSKYNSISDKESAVSDGLTVAWNTRMFQTITTPPIEGGTNDVRIYGHSDADGLGYRLIDKPLGERSVTVATVTGTVAVPPTSSDFGDGAGVEPGFVRSSAFVPGTTRRKLWLSGAGKSELYDLWTPRARRTNVTAITVQSGGANARKMLYDTEERNAAPDIVYAAGTWTVLNPGMYEIRASLSFQSAGNANGYRKMQIRVNGADKAADVRDGTMKILGLSASCEVEVPAGGTIEVWVQQNSSTNIDTRNTQPDENFIEIKRTGATSL